MEQYESNRADIRKAGRMKSHMSHQRAKRMREKFRNHKARACKARAAADQNVEMEK